METMTIFLRLAMILIALLIPTPFLLAVYYFLLRPTLHDPKSRTTSVTVLVLGDIGRSPRMFFFFVSVISEF